MTVPRSPLHDRHRRALLQLLRFGVVGASGVLVNLTALVTVKKLGPGFDDALVAIPLTVFHVRWYHAYSTVAFLVANLWNFQLNRHWTFGSASHARWWREYWPFLSVGLGAQLVGLGLLTLLLHPDSVLALHGPLLDGSSGLRNPLYWGQLIVIVLVTPLSFLLNKLWTFAAVRSHRLGLADPIHPESPEDEPLS